MKNLVFVILILLLAVAGGILAVQHQGQTKLRLENESLQQQLGQMTQLQADNEQLSNRLVEVAATADAQTAELLKLRAEASTLRKQAAQIAELQSKNQQLNAAMTDSGSAQLRNAQAASVPKPANLGRLTLINGIPNQYVLGGDRVCTLTPTLYGNGECNIKADFQFKGADGQPQTATAEITTIPGRPIVLEAGGNSIAFTPDVVPNRGP